MVLSVNDAVFRKHLTAIASFKPYFTRSSTHLRTLLKAILCLSFLFFSSTSFADESTTKAQIRALTDNIVKQLPADQKVVLKALSPERTGLPSDFLRKLVADVESSLLASSNSKLLLSNRLATEDIWSEASEFNNTAFEELYKASSAQIMLLLSARATKAGVEISISAYGLEGDRIGNVIASTGSIVLATDMETAVGVDVNTLNDQMEKVIDTLGKSKNRTTPRADITYKRYIGQFEVEEDDFCPSVGDLSCFDDYVVGVVNGKRYEAYKSELTDIVIFQGDIDNDGYTDSIVESHPGGNGLAPLYVIVSYRGEGRFNTYELDFYDFERPTVVEEFPYWFVRGSYIAMGVGDTDTTDKLIEYRLRDGKLEKTEGGNAAPEVALARFTSKEAFDSVGSSGEPTTYVWSFDFDNDGKNESFECGLWERWGALVNCSLIKDDEAYQFLDTGCKVIAVHDNFVGRFRRLTCDGQAVNLTGPVPFKSENEIASFKQPTTTQKPILVAQIGGWDIFDNRHIDSTCYAASRFSNDREFFIVRKKTGTWIVAFKNPDWSTLKKGTRHSLQFILDRKKRWDVTARATGEGLAINRLDSAFVEALSTAVQMKVVYRGRVIADMRFKGTKPVIRAVTECMSKSSSLTNDETHTRSLAQRSLSTGKLTQAQITVRQQTSSKPAPLETSYSDDDDELAAMSQDSKTLVAPPMPRTKPPSNRDPQFISFIERVRECWVIPPAARDKSITVGVSIAFNDDGSVFGTPKILNNSTSPEFASVVTSITTAITSCQNYKSLPAALSNSSTSLEIEFNPNMFTDDWPLVARLVSNAVETENNTGKTDLQTFQ